MFASLLKRIIILLLQIERQSIILIHLILKENPMYFSLRQVRDLPRRLFELRTDCFPYISRLQLPIPLGQRRQGPRLPVLSHGLINSNILKCRDIIIIGFI